MLSSVDHNTLGVPHVTWHYNSPTLRSKDGEYFINKLILEIDLDYYQTLLSIKSNKEISLTYTILALAGSLQKSKQKNQKGMFLSVLSVFILLHACLFLDNFSLVQSSKFNFLKKKNHFIRIIVTFLYSNYKNHFFKKILTSKQ